MEGPVTLNRALSLPQIVLYGLGTTIGAGIYALVGELAAVSGYLAPLSFLVASLMAGLTAVSFAELSGRYPRCAGASLYVREGFPLAWLSTLTGLLVILAGIVSSSALVNAFVGYLHEFIRLDRIVMIVIVTIAIAMIAIRGVTQSVTAAALITLVEIGGLVLVIIVCLAGPVDVAASWNNLMPVLEIRSLEAALAGSLLAFYAFIGFEDMVEIAEESRHVKRNLPLGILLTLLVTTVLYMAIMISAVMTVPLEELAGSEAPLALIFEYHTGARPVLISVISLFAIINGVLIQVIMVSRVLYGMSTRGQLPRYFSGIHPVTRTPLVATIVASLLVFLLASAGSLPVLAEATSVIMLAVFCLVNLALIRIKSRDPEPADTLVFPLWMPVAGFLVSAGFAVYSLWSYVV